MHVDCKIVLLISVMLTSAERERERYNQLYFLCLLLTSIQNLKMHLKRRMNFWSICAKKNELAYYRIWHQQLILSFQRRQTTEWTTPEPAKLCRFTFNPKKCLRLFTIREILMSSKKFACYSFVKTSNPFFLHKWEQCSRGLQCEKKLAKSSTAEKWMGKTRFIPKLLHGKTSQRDQTRNANLNVQLKKVLSLLMRRLWRIFEGSIVVLFRSNFSWRTTPAWGPYECHYRITSPSNKENFAPS